jgi:lipopolysaccharide export system protein LptA
MRIFAILLLTQLSLQLALHGQGASRLGTPSGDQRKQIDQATEKLRQAQSNGQLDQAKDAAKQLLKKLPEGVTDAAKEALQSPEAKAKAMEAVKSAAQTILPQAQDLLKEKGLPTGALMPAPAQPEPAAPVIEGPKPTALAPLATNPAKKAQPTVVIEADNSVFDLKTSIFIYTGNVRARSPDFYIECEELEVHMVKEESKKEAAKDKAKAAGKVDAKPDPKTANDPVLTKPAEKAPDDVPIQKAIARGPTVTVERRDEQGNVQIGKCRRLDYDKATGYIVLSNNPQVQRGNALQIAIQPDTKMMFDKNGKFTSNPRSRTVILSDDPQGAASTAPAAPQPSSR